jgi:hypothetical protein
VLNTRIVRQYLNDSASEEVKAAGPEPLEILPKAESFSERAAGRDPTPHRVFLFEPAMVPALKVNRLTATAAQGLLRLNVNGTAAIEARSDHEERCL